jgi:prevent-host-death family protein
MQQIHVSKSTFKAKALEYLRQVEASGESLIITDHGRPAIEIKPYYGEQTSCLDELKGSVTQFLDPTSPVGETSWDAIK